MFRRTLPLPGRLVDDFLASPSLRRSGIALVSSWRWPAGESSRRRLATAEEAIRSPKARRASYAHEVGHASLRDGHARPAQGRCGAAACSALDHAVTCQAGNSTSTWVASAHLSRLGLAQLGGRAGADGLPSEQFLDRRTPGPVSQAAGAIAVHWVARVCSSADSRSRRLGPGCPRSFPGPRHAAVGLRSHLLGDIAAHPDRFDAEQRRGPLPRRRWPSPSRVGMRPLVAHCHLGLGKLYRRTGKREQAQEHLTTATTMYREMEMTFWLEQAGRRWRRAALMRCPRCRAENREDVASAGVRGRLSSSARPARGSLNEGGEKFCGGVGSPCASAGPRGAAVQLARRATRPSTSPRRSSPRRPRSRASASR